MSFSALAMVILAGFIHASWNIAAKKAGGDVRFAAFSALVMMVVWAPVGVWLGLQQVPQWNGMVWALIASSGVIHVVYFVVLLRGYRKSDLTVVYPLARGSGPLLTAMVAIVWMGERISSWGLMGIVGVVCGVFLIAGGPALFRPGRTPQDTLRIRKGMAYGLLTGVFIASYTVIDGYAVKVLLVSPILVDYLGNFVRLALLIPTIVRDIPAASHLWRSQWKYACIVGTVSPISYVLVLYAMQSAPLSHVAPAREVSMLFAALMGGHLLGEGDRVARTLGAISIGAGVMALAIG